MEHVRDVDLRVQDLVKDISAGLPALMSASPELSTGTESQRIGALLLKHLPPLMDACARVLPPPPPGATAATVPVPAAAPAVATVLETVRGLSPEIAKGLAATRAGADGAEGARVALCIRLGLVAGDLEASLHTLRADLGLVKPNDLVSFSLPDGLCKPCVVRLTSAYSTQSLKLPLQRDAINLDGPFRSGPLSPPIRNAATAIPSSLIGHEGPPMLSAVQPSDRVLSPRARPITAGSTRINFEGRDVSKSHAPRPRFFLDDEIEDVDVDSPGLAKRTLLSGANSQLGQLGSNRSADHAIRSSPWTPLNSTGVRGDPSFSDRGRASQAHSILAELDEKPERLNVTQSKRMSNMTPLAGDPRDKDGFRRPRTPVPFRPSTPGPFSESKRYAAPSAQSSGLGRNMERARPRTPRPEQNHAPGPDRPRTPAFERPRTPGPARPRTPGPARPRTPGPARPRTPGPARPRTPGPARPRTPDPARPRTPGPDRPRTPGHSQPWNAKRPHTPGRSPLHSPHGSYEPSAELKGVFRQVDPAIVVGHENETFREARKRRSNEHIEPESPRARGLEQEFSSDFRRISNRHDLAHVGDNLHVPNRDHPGDESRSPGVARRSEYTTWPHADLDHRETRTNGDLRARGNERPSLRGNAARDDLRVYDTRRNVFPQSRRYSREYLDSELDRRDDARSFEDFLRLGGRRGRQDTREYDCKEISPPVTDDDSLRPRSRSRITREVNYERPESPHDVPPLRTLRHDDVDVRGTAKTGILAPSNQIYPRKVYSPRRIASVSDRKLDYGAARNYDLLVEGQKRVDGRYLSTMPPRRNDEREHSQRQRLSPSDRFRRRVQDFPWEPREESLEAFPDRDRVRKRPRNADELVGRNAQRDLHY